MTLEPTEINTGGGAAVPGNVDTGGGGFIGRGARPAGDLGWAAVAAGARG